MNDSVLDAIEARLAALEAANAMPATASEEEEEQRGNHGVGAAKDETGAFRIDSFGYICDCHFMFGRTVYAIPDVPLSGDGLYYLKIPHSQPNSATIVVSSGGTNTLDETYIPLFSLRDGVVVADYRGMPCIPAYE